MFTLPPAQCHGALRRSSALFAVIAALTLGACGGSDPVESETSTGAPAAKVTTEAEGAEPTTEAEPSPTPTPTPALPESPTARTLDMECSGNDSENRRTVVTLEEAWAEEPDTHTQCSIYSDMEVLLDVERDALEHAYGPGSDALHILYGMCGQTMLGNAGKLGPKPLGEGQRLETEGALILCPEHPDAEPVRELMRAAVENDQLRAEGKMIGPGTHRVGEDVQPGTYVSESSDGEPFSGCYWEVTDEAGEPIDNYFSSSAIRVEMTVPDYAYSVTVDGCGEFEPVK